MEFTQSCGSAGAPAATAAPLIHEQLELNAGGGRVGTPVVTPGVGSPDAGTDWDASLSERLRVGSTHPDAQIRKAENTPKT